MGKIKRHQPEFSIQKESAAWKHWPDAAKKRCTRRPSNWAHLQTQMMRN